MRDFTMCNQIVIRLQWMTLLRAASDDGGTAAAHLCDTSGRPDVVVLQHHHSTQVLSVHRHPPNQHGILLHQTEARRCLARACHFSMPTTRSCHRSQLRAACGNAWSPDQAVQSRPFSEEEAPRWASHHSCQCDTIWACGKKRAAPDHYWKICPNLDTICLICRCNK